VINFADNNSPTLGIDINQGWGWGWGDYAWAQTVPANTDLRPLLIQHLDILASLSARIKEGFLGKAN
jgi:hypothetical protein